MIKLIEMSQGTIYIHLSAKSSITYHHRRSGLILKYINEYVIIKCHHIIIIIYTFCFYSRTNCFQLISQCVSQQQTATFVKKKNVSFFNINLVMISLFDE